MSHIDWPAAQHEAEAAGDVAGKPAFDDVRQFLRQNLGDTLILGKVRGALSESEYGVLLSVISYYASERAAEASREMRDVIFAALDVKGAA